jgi:hypothetical protein
MIHFPDGRSLGGPWHPRVLKEGSSMNWDGFVYSVECRGLECKNADGKPFILISEDFPNPMRVEVEGRKNFEPLVWLIVCPECKSEFLVKFAELVRRKPETLELPEHSYKVRNVQAVVQRDAGSP